jgi:hypothetical protein
LARVRVVHLAGGRWAGRYRIDDHRHDVEGPVFALLEELAAVAPSPLDVIVERDGNYPSAHAWLAELGAARDALARGRERQAEAEACLATGATWPRASRAEGVAQEDALARLLLGVTDPGPRASPVVPSVDPEALRLASAVFRARSSSATHDAPSGRPWRRLWR